MSEPRPQPAPAGAGVQGRREKPLVDTPPTGPWKGRVRVTPITRLEYSAVAVHYEVLAEWTGPPLPGFDPINRAVNASDTYLTDDQMFARALADWAIDQLAQPAVPDLRARVTELRRRRG